MVSLPDRTLTIAIVKRLLDSLLTAWAAVTLTFFALRIVGGDPVSSLLSQGLTTVERAEALRRSLGYDLPIVEQYLRFLSGLLRGDLGISLYSGQRVAAVIDTQLGGTLQLASLSLVIALVLGILLGGLGAMRRLPALRSGARALSGLASSLPVATTGVVSLLVIALLLRGIAGIGLWLPAAVLGFAASGPFARAVQSGLERSLRSPYLLAARARGLRRGGRLYWHALRPALPPAVSLIALETAFLFSGTVVTETVFSRPGLGRTLVRSILQGDFPVAQSIVGLAALFYVGSQVMADAFSWILDPRTRPS
jgi:peptide/nickel transport system permease protein